MSKKLKYFIFVASIFALADFGLYFFLILRAKQVTGSIVIAMLFYVLFNIFYASFAIPFGELSDKIGRRSILFFGYLLFFLVSLFIIFLDKPWQLALIFIGYGLVYAITKSNQTALVADLAEDMKGTALGFYQMVIGLVSIPAGIIAGILWTISPRIMFAYIAVVSFIALIFLRFVEEK